MTESAVIQVKRGIGDVMWHLPFARAIAAKSPDGKVTFLAPPTSQAKELLAGEPCIAETVYFEHAGSELRRATNLVQLTGLLRRRRFGTVWILDRTIRPALAAFAAAVPNRIGIGLGPQRWLLTNPGIGHGHFHDHPIGWLTALLKAMQVPLPTTEPNLHLPGDTLAAIGTRYSACPRPWIVVGIGGSHREQDWPDAAWIELFAGLRHGIAGTLFMIGGAAYAARAQRLIMSGSGSLAINACDLKLGEAAALLRLADTFVGTDSGPMNVAAAVGTPAFVLFGVNPVLNYSAFIRPITPTGGRGPDGMKRIAPATVLERISSSL